MLALICPGLFSCLWRPVHLWLQRTSSPVVHGDFSCVHTKVSRICLPSGSKVWTPACPTEVLPGISPAAHRSQVPALPTREECLRSSGSLQILWEEARGCRTRCPAGSSTPKSNPLLPEGMQKPLLLLATSWCPQPVCRCAFLALLDLSRLVEFVGFWCGLYRFFGKVSHTNLPLSSHTKKKKRKSWHCTCQKLWVKVKASSCCFFFFFKWLF